jgi:hypothetical protein
VKIGDGVAARERGVDEVPAEEARAAEDQELHRLRVRATDRCVQRGIAAGEHVARRRRRAPPRQSVTTPPAASIDGISDWMS